MSSTDNQPFAMPDRIAIDGKGYGWRVWDDEDYWSMVPVNPDNSPIPTPITFFVPDHHIEGWRAVCRAKDQMISGARALLREAVREMEMDLRPGADVDPESLLARMRDEIS